MASSGATVTTTLAPASGPFAPGRTPVPGFSEVAVRIVPGPDGKPLVICVLLAETRAQRARGLMEVTDPDLGGYDGMAFVFPDDVDGGFYMRNTPIPLSIAYVDAAGAVVATRDMEPCEDREGCPDYPPGKAYRTTLEVAQGDLEPLGLTEGGPARLTVGGRCAPG